MKGPSCVEPEKPGKAGSKEQGLTEREMGSRPALSPDLEDAQEWLRGTPQAAESGRFGM